MNPEYYKFIGGGELIVFGVIVSLIIIFFKYRVPRIREEFREKMGKEDCSLVREQCNRLILLRLDKINDHFDEQIKNIAKQFDTVIQNQNKIQDRFDRFLKLNGG